MLIIGLGNPGKNYERTRHNIGFRVVDALRERWAFPDYARNFESELARGMRAGRSVALMKPRTFMNLSGSAVLAAVSFYKIPPSELWVVHDDLDLPLGRLRIRRGGSAGGHNGVADIMRRLGTDAFVRFRLGIGRPEEGREAVESYVLGKFSKEEEAAAKEAVERCVLAVETAMAEGLDRAMTVYNA